MMEEVNATQAAILSGYSERTIRRKIASGILPARRVSSNRFAIRVSDLPARHGADPLVERVAALERRVRELEHRLQFLSALESTQAGTDEVQQDPAAILRELLLQLVQENERIGTLLAAPEPVTESKWEKQHQKQSRG